VAGSAEKREIRSSSGRWPTGRPRTKLAVDHLSLWYGPHAVLTDVTLDLPERSITAIVGPTGCGKSALLRQLNRMNDLIDGCQHTGQVHLDGTDIHTLPDVQALRRRVGLVVQPAQPFPLTVYENVVYGPRVAGVRERAKLDATVERCLRQTALAQVLRDQWHTPALRLPVEQQQRLCIARALATEPEVLLFDEPAAALDPKATASVEDVLYELRLDYTIAVVTHNLQRAARISDWTAVFANGRLLEVGATGQLFTRPQLRKTEDYLTGRGL
jgi:phosphate transport system ATP-binding protein